MRRRLDGELARLEPELRAVLAGGNFDEQGLRERAARCHAGDVGGNFVPGAIRGPDKGDVLSLPARGSSEHTEAEARGMHALAAGHVALAVLAGGMATRMGGIVKAAVEALPGKTFLDLRLGEVAAIERRYGAAPPLWLMTSFATDRDLRAALGSRLDGDHVATFQQFVSLRLTSTGELFQDDRGGPSLYATGHGDLPDALQRSGLLQRFVERGGKVVMMTNVDNLGGTLDPAIIGWHLMHGDPVTSEVVDKLPSDRGGIPVRVDGSLCVLEEFRIPPSFDPATVRVFNTNVFHFDARALAELDIPWTFFVARKKVGDKDVVQFERLINEVTAHLPTRYLHVPRTGPEARFLPVKDWEELAARRDEIDLVARTRGLL